MSEDEKNGHSVSGFWTCPLCGQKNLNRDNCANCGYILEED